MCWHWVVREGFFFSFFTFLGNTPRTTRTTAPSRVDQKSESRELWGRSMSEVAVVDNAVVAVVNNVMVVVVVLVMIVLLVVVWLWLWLWLWLCVWFWVWLLLMWL